MFRQTNAVRALAFVVPVAAVMKLTVFEPAMIGVAAEQTHALGRARGAVSDNVLVISIDGLRPESIERFDATVLKQLTQEGAVARAASTVSASRTLAPHASMLTGSPELRITFNDDRTDTAGTIVDPTIFELAKDAGFVTAAFFSTPELNRMVRPGTLDYVSGPRRGKRVRAKRTVEAATKHMLTERPNLVFVHLAEPACHDDGWMSRRYGRAVARADVAVGQLLAAAERAYGRGNFSVIVTSAHGGQGSGRGRGLDTHTHVPWIAWGAGVKPKTVPVPVKTMDTAATVLWLLGVDQPLAWSGQAVKPAYTSAAVRRGDRPGTAAVIRTEPARVSGRRGAGA